MTLRSFARLRYLPVLAVAVALAGTLMLRAALADAEDAGAAGAAAELDAAVEPVSNDLGVVAPAPNPPDPPAATVDSQPAPNHASDGASTAMTHGAALAAMLLGLVSVLRSILARLEPAPGEPIDPTSWRARAIPVLSSAIALALASCDVLTGARWYTLVPVALTAVALLWSAIDPPRGSKRAQAPIAGTLVALLILGSLTACRPVVIVPGQPAPPSWTDRLADLIPVARGLLCAPPHPSTPPDTVDQVLAAARAIACPPPAPAVP